MKASTKVALTVCNSAYLRVDLKADWRVWKLAYASAATKVACSESSSVYTKVDQMVD